MSPAWSVCSPRNWQQSVVGCLSVSISLLPCVPQSVSFAAISCGILFMSHWTQLAHIVLPELIWLGIPNRKREQKIWYGRSFFIYLAVMSQLVRLENNALFCSGVSCRWNMTYYTKVYTALILFRRPNWQFNWVLFHWCLDIWCLWTSTG